MYEKTEQKSTALTAITEGKAPLELVDQAENHFRKPTQKEIDATIEYSKEQERLLNQGARLTNEEKELAMAHSHERFYRMQHASGRKEAARDIANCLITQGRYEEALDYADELQLNELAELIEARDRDDNERCSCPSIKLENINVPSEVVVKRVFMPSVNSWCWLYRCSQCGFSNLVASLPTEVANYHATRMNAINRK